MEFLVWDVWEEYFIVKRMCCPSCGTPALRCVLQKYIPNYGAEGGLKEAGASGEADELNVRCLKCGHELKLIFHLHRVYTEKLERIVKGGDDS